MALAQLSPNSVMAPSAPIDPHTRTDQSTTTATAGREADNAVRKTTTDTVTISRRAAEMAAKTREPAQKAKEARTEKARKQVDIRA